jgi:hypothetical protein
VIGALLSPLWFVTIGGVNLNPADFILLFTLASFILRTNLLPYSLSRQSVIAIIIFLGIVGLSILWSSNKLGGLLSFAQYLFIFVGVVPIVSYSLRNRSIRWQVFLAIWGATTVLTLLGIYTYVFGDVYRVRRIMLWYSNPNQFYWLVATAFLCSIAFALEEAIPLGIKFVSVVLAAVEAVLIINGTSLSAIIMLAGGAWLFGAWLAQRNSKRIKIVFTTATVITGIVSIVAIVRYWDWVYIQGSLESRFSQYTGAIRQGVQHFPLGTGIDAYGPSVHNFVLNYFVEVGILGAAAFLALILVWCRDVAIRSLRYPFQVQPFEFAFVVIFATYILVFSFQPVPVQRFWWVLFGASLGVAQDRLPSHIDQP